MRRISVRCPGMLLTKICSRAQDKIKQSRKALIGIKQELDEPHSNSFLFREGRAKIKLLLHVSRLQDPGTALIKIWGGHSNTDSVEMFATLKIKLNYYCQKKSCCEVNRTISSRGKVSTAMTIFAFTGLRMHFIYKGNQVLAAELKSQQRAFTIGVCYKEGTKAPRQSNSVQEIPHRKNCSSWNHSGLEITAASLFSHSSCRAFLNDVLTNFLLHSPK